MKYEFKTKKLDESRLADFLENEAEDGWEFVSITPCTWKENPFSGFFEVRDYVAIVKRPS